MSASQPNVLTGARILVVDDVDADRCVLTHYLQRQGCRAYVGINGDDAFHKAVAAQPDLILMDVRMPSCDGLTACRRIVEHHGGRIEILPADGQGCKIAFTLPKG